MNLCQPLKLVRFKNYLLGFRIDNAKDGPSYKEVADKYKGKPGAEERLVKHITTGEKAKFPDGHEEEHKIIKTKDMNEVKNLVAWILSL